MTTQIAYGIAGLVIGFFYGIFCRANVNRVKDWDDGFQHGFSCGKDLSRQSYNRTLWQCEELERIARL